MNILDLIFPKHCLTCWRFGRYFCDRCAVNIRMIESRETICPMCGRPSFGGATHPRCQTRYALDGLISFFHYNGIVREAIKTLKYRRVTDLAQEFISFIPAVDSVDRFLVPIPLHPSRFRDRGFNQAEVLGKLLADRLHIPIQSDILRRVKHITPQVAMKDRAARLTNMAGVFTVDKRRLEHYFVNSSARPVLLFDDVFTTGATMRSAGETLKRAGAKSVWAVTMAR